MNTMLKWKRCLAALAFVCVSVVVPALSADAEPAPPPVQEESNWVKFREGAKQAGGAIADGTKNTAKKVAEGAERAGDAVVRGSKKAGEAIAEGYEEAKEYVEEKVD